jgi:hypothetical protein
MTGDPASLERLHDIVMPPAAPWWPPAPGWYVVAGAVALATVVVAARAWAQYRRAAYRRAALAELGSLPPTAEATPRVAEILKRVALAAYPREEVAGLSGAAWVLWLGETGGRPVPADVSVVLTQNVYGVATRGATEVLKAFAIRWIRRHGGIRSW